MKKIGVLLCESLMEESNTSVKDSFWSISTKESPNGRLIRMKLVMALMIRSGLRHLRTKSFWNGMVSSFFQSKGNFYSSGTSSLYQSLNLLGASFSTF